jgi:hypothetical protein
MMATGSWTSGIRKIHAISAPSRDRHQYHKVTPLSGIEEKSYPINISLIIFLIYAGKDFFLPHRCLVSKYPQCWDFETLNVCTDMARLAVQNLIPWVE